MDFKVIATDFDGTLCEDKWPEIGAPNNEIINYLKEQRAAGIKIILWTCRTDNRLGEAVRWCCELGLSFDAINENLPEVVDIFGTESRKVFAHEYIDDKFCTKFKLPFVKRETGINDDVINKLERAFGFPLYDWQKRYLKGEDNAIPNGGRQNGKTFSYCIRLLLENREPFDLRESCEVDKLVDENHGPHYNRFFRDYLRELNDQLLKAGLSTNAEKKKHYDQEGVFIRTPFIF